MRQRHRQRAAKSRTLCRARRSQAGDPQRPSSPCPVWQSHRQVESRWPDLARWRRAAHQRAWHTAHQPRSCAGCSHPSPAAARHVRCSCVARQTCRRSAERRCCTEPDRARRCHAYDRPGCVRSPGNARSLNCSHPQADHCRRRARSPPHRRTSRSPASPPEWPNVSPRRSSGWPPPPACRQELPLACWCRSPSPRSADGCFPSSREAHAAGSLGRPARWAEHSAGAPVGRIRHSPSVALATLHHRASRGGV
mmetsp:Transcript_774/g.1782  ORF Transcript_774/g.1782 Transcript_774/m.1782 type:complete len:252 (+) Transcript_774:755-1510(+)